MVGSVVGTAVGGTGPSTELMATVWWDTYLWVREVLERVNIVCHGTQVIAAEQVCYI